MASEIAIGTAIGIAIGIAGNFKGRNAIANSKELR